MNVNILRGFAMPHGADTKLDCGGLFCPMPILKTREAMKHLAPGQVLEMTSDDPASEADMKSWTARAGHELLEIEKNGTVFRFFVRKTGSGPDAAVPRVYLDY